MDYLLWGLCQDGARIECMTTKEGHEKSVSLHKTSFSEAQARQFLLDYYELPYPEVQAIKGGESSQAFRFKTSDGPHVLRVNAHAEKGFLKDGLAATEFVGPTLPIPRVLHTGTLASGYYYAVSKAVPGVTLDKLDVGQRIAILPKIANVLNAIHACKPLNEGFGEWGLDGKGQYKSWRQYILSSLGSLRLDVLPPYYDGSLQLRMQRAVEGLMPKCPEERQLLHGDFGMDNVLVHDGEVSGVIDWEQSAYGDPLYDVARLDFWDPEIGYQAWFKEYYSDQPDCGLRRNFDERIACYQLVTAIGAMNFYVETDQPKKYEHVKARALQTLNR